MWCQKAKAEAADGTVLWAHLEIFQLLGAFCVYACLPAVVGVYLPFSLGVVVPG